MSKKHLLIPAAIVFFFFMSAMFLCWANTSFAGNIEDVIQTVEDFNSPYSKDLVNLLRELDNSVSGDDYSKTIKIATRINETIDKLTPEQRSRFLSAANCITGCGNGSCDITDCTGIFYCVCNSNDDAVCVCHTDPGGSATIRLTTANGEKVGTTGGDVTAIVNSLGPDMARAITGDNGHCYAHCTIDSCDASAGEGGLAGCICIYGVSTCQVLELRPMPVITPFGIIILIISIAGISVFTLKKLLG